MQDLTWRIFCMTGSIDSYLLMKEMENENNRPAEEKSTIQEISEESGQ
ncbi:YqzL family protein [Sporolactobacillus sp. THM19-2]|nr:YqzL family protein [Sporolactobacillus sp. THM19-2]RYL90407.1 YqzL family protein [Sporolactobacillus sp. THM19-2]